MIKRFFPDFGQLRKSEFFGNTVTLISGTTISQVIPILFAPLTARIYPPQAYGILGTYMSISILASVFATLQYSNAILIPKDEEEGKSIIRLCLRNTHIIAGICLLLVLLGAIIFATELMHSGLRYWIYFIPFSVGMSGYTATFSALANRNKSFRLLSTNRVIAVIGSTIVSISLGLLLGNEYGLVLGFLVSQFIGGAFLGHMVIKEKGNSWAEFLSVEGIQSVRKKYSSFPKLSLTADFINNSTNQIPVLLLSSYAGNAAVGWFNMSNRILGLPLTFIASAIGEIFRQRAAHDIQEHGNCRVIFKKTLISLTLLSVIPCLVLLFFGPQLFSVFLGEKWREAGVLSQIMAPVFLLRFINSPLSFIVYLVNKLAFNLFATAYLSITSILIFYFSLKYFSLYTSIGLYAANYSVIYCFMIYKNYQFSK